MLYFVPMDADCCLQSLLDFILQVRGLISPGDLVVVAAGRRNSQGVNESLCHYEIQTVV